MPTDVPGILGTISPPVAGNVDIHLCWNASAFFFSSPFRVKNTDSVLSLIISNLNMSALVIPPSHWVLCLFLALQIEPSVCAHDKYILRHELHPSLQLDFS